MGEDRSGVRTRMKEVVARMAAILTAMSWWLRHAVSTCRQEQRGFGFWFRFHHLVEVSSGLHGYPIPGHRRWQLCPSEQDEDVWGGGTDSSARGLSCHAAIPSSRIRAAFPSNFLGLGIGFRHP